MAMTTVRRRITLTFSGEIDGEQIYDATTVTDSPAYVQVYTLPAEVGIIFELPSELNGFGTYAPTALTILKPGSFAGTLVLKGAYGADLTEGVYLHPTDPDTISLDADNQASIVLRASGECTVRLIWT